MTWSLIQPGLCPDAAVWVPNRGCVTPVYKSYGLRKPYQCKAISSILSSALHAAAMQVDDDNIRVVLSFQTGDGAR